MVFNPNKKHNKLSNYENIQQEKERRAIESLTSEAKKLKSDIEEVRGNTEKPQEVGRVDKKISLILENH